MVTHCVYDIANMITFLIVTRATPKTFVCSIWFDCVLCISDNNSLSLIFFCHPNQKKKKGKITVTAKKTPKKPFW